MVLLAISADRAVCGKALSDERGRFRVRPEVPHLPPVRLITGHRFRELAEPAREIAWGTEDLELTLRETRPVEIVVANAVTGENIAQDLLVTLEPLLKLIQPKDDNMGAHLQWFLSDVEVAALNEAVCGGICVGGVTPGLMLRVCRLTRRRLSLRHQPGLGHLEQAPAGGR